MIPEEKSHLGWILTMEPQINKAQSWILLFLVQALPYIKVLKIAVKLKTMLCMFCVFLNKKKHSKFADLFRNGMWLSVIFNQTDSETHRHKTQTDAHIKSVSTGCFCLFLFLNNE